MKSRVLTALVLIPIVLAVLLSTSFWPFAVLSSLIVFQGCREIAGMLKTNSEHLSIVGLVLLAFFAAWAYNGAQASRLVAEAGAALLVGSVLVIFFSKSKPGSLNSSLSTGWVLGPILCLMALHNAGGVQPWDLKPPILLSIVPLWGGDTAAIFAGKAFGKHLLAPKISPKKTVEGSVANLLACIGVAIGLGAWMGVSLPIAAACGAAAGVFGQAGDLFESWVKRRADLKDSGSLLPGHGGIMDRIDSILFTAPVVCLILLFCR